MIKSGPSGPLLKAGIALCLVLAALFLLFRSRPAERSARVAVPEAEQKVPAEEREAFQERVPAAAAIPDQEQTQPKPVAPSRQETLSPPAPADDRPRVIIIVDDMGYRLESGRAMLDLDLVLSFSFLPGAPHTAELVRLAQDQGRDIMLHLPLEPLDPKWNLGPGGLFTSMDQERIAELFAADLAQVPAIGVNNHMGSRFTADEAAMRRLFPLLKRSNLFFLDSLTSPASIATRLGKELGVTVYRRDLFLDNQRDPSVIAGELDRLVLIARRHGRAIGLCHPYPETVKALQGWRPPGDVRLDGIRSLVP